MSVSSDILPGVEVPTPQTPVVIGRIARPVGVGGEVKVISESAVEARLVGMKSLLIAHNGQCRSFKVGALALNGSWYRIKLSGIDNPETAAYLDGWEIVVGADDRPNLPKGDYYIDDIIGCKVSASDGTDLGWVEEVIQQGHHDIWVVKGGFGEVMVPAVKEFILQVDLSSHKIVVQRVEGLWEAR